MTQHYIGTKQVTAWPAEKDGVAGYGITYSDGYQSWSPKKQFESAYLAMGEGNDGSKITQGMVDGFILNAQSVKLGQKTTVVTLWLANGFEVVGSSSCVDPANYDHELGTKLATQRAKDQVWMVLGFLLQTARNGVTFANTGCKPAVSTSSDPTVHDAPTKREPTIADQAESGNGESTTAPAAETAAAQ